MTKEQMKDFFNMIPVCGDTFRKGMRKLEADRKEWKRVELEDFKRDSKSWNAKNAAIDERYQTKRKELEEQATAELSEIMNKMRADIKASVSRLDVAALHQLSALRDIPVTSAELEILISKYGAFDNYWNNKMLVKIAEDNGIVSDREQLGLLPSVDTMLTVLDEISNDVTEMLAADDYEDPSIKTLSHMRTKQAIAWEQKFSNGLFESCYTPADKASRLYGMLVNAGDVLIRGIKLKSFMINCTDQEVKDRLLSMIAEHDTLFDTTVLNIAGVENEINDFRTGQRTIKEEYPASNADEAQE